MFPFSYPLTRRRIWMHWQLSNPRRQAARRLQSYCLLKRISRRKAVRMQRRRQPRLKKRQPVRMWSHWLQNMKPIKKTVTWIYMKFQMRTKIRQAVKMLRQCQLKMMPRRQLVRRWRLWKLKSTPRRQEVSLILATLTCQGRMDLVLELSSQTCCPIDIDKFRHILMYSMVRDATMVVFIITETKTRQPKNKKKKTHPKCLPSRGLSSPTSKKFKLIPNLRCIEVIARLLLWLKRQQQRTPLWQCECL